MRYSTLLLLVGATYSIASPVWPHYTVDNEHFEVLAMRASTPINPSAVSDVTCMDPKRNIVFHDQNVAELNICGGIAGSTMKCSGSASGAPPSRTTEGRSGSAKFTLEATTKGATINITKRRWEQCVRAARAICPTGSMRGTCSGGASSGSVDFTLDWP